jgi:DNA invertase Pin-like site-specific DNA recombinase
MSENVRAAIYCAKSTEDRNASLPEQLGDCRQMAAENGWTIVGEFSDEKFSAYNGNRGPGLEAAKRCAIEAARASGTMLVAMTRRIALSVAQTAETDAEPS